MGGLDGGRAGMDAGRVLWVGELERHDGGLLTGRRRGRGAGIFPLAVAPSGRFLVDQRGAPFFVNGDTPWSLTHNLTYDEAVRYMENRRAKGINALIVSIPDAYGPDGSASDPPDRQGNRPFQGNDITLPSEPYWQHVDRVLAKSEELGFLVLFFPAYLGCCNDGYVALFQTNGEGRARTYGRFVGQRYAARRNLIWVHGAAPRSPRLGLGTSWSPCAKGSERSTPRAPPRGPQVTL